MLVGIKHLLGTSKNLLRGHLLHLRVSAQYLRRDTVFRSPLLLTNPPQQRICQHPKHSEMLCLIVWFNTDQFDMRKHAKGGPHCCSQYDHHDCIADLASRIGNAIALIDFAAGDKGKHRPR